MNSKQRVVLLVGLALITIAGVFPEKRVVGWSRSGTSFQTFDRSAGRWAILVEPRVGKQFGGVGDQWYRIDAGRLVAELAIIVGVTGVCYLGFGWPARRDATGDSR